MNSWKHRLKGKNLEEAKIEETTEVIEKRHNDNVQKAGLAGFNKAFAEAELLRFHQQILNDRQELQKRHQAATGKPKLVVPDEVQNADGVQV